MELQLQNSWFFKKDAVYNKFFIIFIVQSMWNVWKYTS